MSRNFEKKISQSPALPFCIGGVEISPPLVLAPMAGITHSPFRRLVAGFGGVGLFFSEMLSARHLVHDVRHHSRWLQHSPTEHPLAWQIVAATPEEAVDGAGHLLTRAPEIIDLNLACPAPNISGKRKAGGHLLNDLAAITAMLEALRAAVPVPLTVKIRLGRKPDAVFLQDLAAVIAGCGIDAVTLHPRLTTEKLKRRARWEYIARLKEMLAIPVIGNGDVKTAGDCRRMFAETGCDGVMIGRAAVQKPWLFAEIMGAEFDLSPTFLHDTYRRAITLITDFFPEDKAKGRIKEFTWHFSRNLTFGHRFAARLQSKRNLAECLEFINENFMRAA